MADILDIIENYLTAYVATQPSEFSPEGAALARSCGWGHPPAELYHRRSHQATTDTHLACRACEREIASDPVLPDPYA